MLSLKFLAFILVMGLNCLVVRPMSQEDFEEILAEHKSTQFLLLSVLRESNFTISKSCVADQTCLVNTLQGRNTTTSLRMFLREVYIPSYENYRSALVSGESRNVTRSTQSVSILSLFNYTNCGVYPACTVHYLSKNLYNFTCDRPLMIFAGVLGIILSVVIICSNAFIIAVTLRTKSLRKSHGIFKLSLAFSDLIAGLFILPSIVYNTLNTIDFEKRHYSVEEIAQVTNVISSNSNSSAAIFFGVMGILSTITAVYSLLLLSIDSYLSVRWPMHYRIGDIMNSRRALMAVAFVWITAVLVAFLPIVAEKYLVYGLAYYSFMYIPIIRPIYSTDAPTALRYLHAILYSIFVWGVPFLVTWILTVLTSIRSRELLQSMRESRRRSVRSKQNLDKVDRDLVRTVTVVLSLFTITILPVLGVSLAVAIVPEDFCTSDSISLAFFITTYILICGRFLNVFVYNVFNKEFRQAARLFFMEMIGFIFCCQGAGTKLPKKSLSAKSSSGVQGSSKSRERCESKETRETGISTRTVSASTVASEKGLLSPGFTTSKLSISSIPEETEPGINDQKDSTSER